MRNLVRNLGVLAIIYKLINVLFSMKILLLYKFSYSLKLFVCLVGLAKMGI